MDIQAAYSLVDDDIGTLEAFRILDEEVNKHTNFILSLKTRRNAFAPISKLPPEVLARIFGFVSQAPPVLSWIKVSYVCRTWRNIALSHPSIWSLLPLAYRRWTKEMLDRSKMASLTIDIDYSATSYPRTLRETTTLALSHSSRIRTLCLVNVDPDIMQIWLSGMPKVTPRMETLHLSVSRRSLDPLLERGCDLPPELLSTTDCLRRFEVTRFKFNWDSLLSKSLTHVKINDVPPSARPTRSQLWGFLQKMPLLESLDLCNALPDSDISLLSESPHHSIYLSLLQNITVSAITSQILGLLQYLSFPSTTIVDIDCKGSPATQFDFTGIISWASTFLATPKKTRGSIRSLDIRSPYSMPGVIFRAYSEVMSDDEYSKPGVRPKFRMSLASRWAPDIDINEMDKIMVDVFGALPVQGIVALRLDQIETRSFFSSCTLTQTFGTLPQLRSVAAVGQVAKVLLGALKEDLPNRRSTRSHHNQISFPALRSIALRDVDFENVISIDSLEAVIKLRNKRGVEVRELKLEDCIRITQEDVAGLEEVVPTVKWDGIESGFTDEEEDYYGDPMDFDEDLGYDSDDGYDFYDPFY